MNRIEIIFNQSIEEDVFLALKDIPEAQFFTLIPTAYGKGYTNPKMGDSIWPEENKVMIIYTKSDKAVKKIKKALKDVRERFVNEGLAYFVIESCNP